jgi:choline kinase
MKVFILAAGRGTRISREINGKPKCTVAIEPGKTLIEYTIDSLLSRGVTDINLVVGYQHQDIRDVLKGKPVKFFTNPFFDVTNSIASLWFAQEAFRQRPDDCLIMNGDVYLSGAALDAVLAEKKSPVMFYDTERVEGADYKFLCRDGVLVKYGKELTVEETSGEYVGCASFTKAYVPEFLERLSSLIGGQSHSLWWENVLYTLSHEHEIFVRDLAGCFWGEVDFIEDYERIMAFHQKQSSGR